MHFRGSICALVTPFDPQGELDLGAWKRLLDLHLEAGTDGVVVGGSTGESGALEPHELTSLLREAVARMRGHCKVIAGCGAMSTRRALRLQQLAVEAGVDGTLVVTPAYVRPTQAGLLAHYRALADASDVPIILYNVPSRTGCDLLPGTVAELALHPHIVAVKEAVCDPARMHDLLASRLPGFAVLSGDDGTALRALEAGADGVVSVAANVIPRAFKTLCVAAASGLEHAHTLNAELSALFDFLACEPNPVPVKWLLHRCGLMDDRLRLPLLSLDEKLRPQADTILSELRREGVESGKAIVNALV